MKGFIKLFSFVFYPLFIPAYATLFYFLLAGKYLYNNEVYLIFIQVLILTILLPVSIFYLLRSLAVVKTKMLADNKERRLPLAINCLLLLMLTEYSFKGFSIQELYFYFLGTLISYTAALLLVLRHVKASLHMMGITSLTMFAVSLSVYYHVRLIVPIAILVMCCGYVASSRLQLKAHTPAELIIGSLLGIVPQLALWYVWLLPAM
jgi:hypothetical protein